MGQKTCLLVPERIAIMEGLFGLIHESFKKYPERIFVRCGDSVWTYSQAYTMALGIADCLSASGVQKGDRVCIYCENSLQYIAAFFGIMRVNAIAVPVNPSRLAENLLAVWEKCSPRLILTCFANLEKLSQINDKLKTDIVNIDELSFSSSCNNTGGHDIEIDAGEPAMLLFTSGTTAYPKGVTLTHGNLLANTKAIIEYLKLNCDDSVLMTLPFTYSYGNSILLTHACAGASIVIENSTTYPYKVLEGLKKYGVTGFSTVGSYINLMLKYIRNSTENADYFKTLRYITFAGESTNNDDIRYINKYYPGIEVFVMYGQTEAGARLSYLSPVRLKDKLGSIGKGLSNVILKVVNEWGCLVKPGEIGEVAAYGPNIMKGYWGDPQATEEVLKDGWLYTGDYATVDEDGFIYIKGRKTDMIKYMGHRISPVEIESIINGFEYVKESAVVEGEVDGMHVIKAFIVYEKECAMEEIRRFVHSKLPAYMRPHVFVAIEQLPRTESGKLKRSGLRRVKCAE